MIYGDNITQTRHFWWVLQLKQDYILCCIKWKNLEKFNFQKAVVAYLLSESTLVSGSNTLLGRTLMSVQSWASKHSSLEFSVMCRCSCKSKYKIKTHSKMELTSWNWLLFPQSTNRHQTSVTLGKGHWYLKDITWCVWDNSALGRHLACTWLAWVWLMTSEGPLNCTRNVSVCRGRGKPKALPGVLPHSKKEKDIGWER